MKDLNQHTDDLFRQGFSGHEASFDPAAWEHMQTLLNKEDDLKPVLFVHDNTTKKRKKTTLLILTIMSLLTLLSIASSLLFNNQSNTVNSNKMPNNSNPSAPAVFADKTDKTVAKTQATNKPTISADKAKISVNQKVNPQQNGTSNSIADKGVASSDQSDKSEKTDKTGGASNTSKSDDQEPVKILKDTFLTAMKNGKVYKVLTRTTWVPEEYDWVVDNSQKTVNSGFIGIHFTGQRNRGADSGSAGFNLQLMSGNRIQHKYWGLYGGIDWGMQFYGKSKKSNVALNNTRADSGFARLRSHSMDFLGRGHLEYARFPLIPYINVMAGPRIYATNQQVSSYVPLKETESSQSNNVHTSATMVYGFGAGLRLRVSPVISIDARYEWINGLKVKQVDLNNSTFNGLSHELRYYTSKPRQEQFKFGILIDLSETQYEKKLIREGYYKVTTIDSLQIDAKDSNKIYLPCNCGPCPGSNSKVTYPGSRESEDVIVYPRTREYQQEDNNTEPRNRNNSNQNNNSSSGSKGSFPGIRPPAPKPVNPN